MSPPLVLRPEARADIAAARDWYDQQRPGLGDEFVDALDDLFDRVAAMPELHPVVLNGVRRTKMRRFPYVVYYRAFPNRTEVVAVLHGSRDPGVWQGRT